MFVGAGYATYASSVICRYWVTGVRGKRYSYFKSLTALNIDNISVTSLAWWGIALDAAPPTGF
jgi:hypothetical protein